jgi:polysaccharide pyruvyl transferase WcaK-like protein
MTARTLAFFGNFGTSNLGNEFTLRSILQHARRYRPEARLHCICPDPEETTRTHAVPASRMSYRNDRAFASKAFRRSRHPVVRLLRRLFVRLPLEVLEWREAFRALRGADMLIMPGTGMLGDFGIRPLDLHYQILKWSIVARMRSCKLLFVSVGAGPIDHPVSRWIVKSAISLADYRSYRDRFSQRYLDGIGFDASKDRVYPDLAFSLVGPAPDGAAEGGGASPVVGVGLMEYYGKSWSGEEGAPAYRDYIAKLARFVAWLLGRHYVVRLLVGDLAYDTRVKADLLRALADGGRPPGAGQVLDEPVTSLDELWTQIARTDMVVATRFHNVLLGLMLGKPVLALSYHQKVRSLMTAAGVSDYCQDIEDLDVQRLREQFLRLETKAESVRSSVRRKAGEYRALLDEQYRHIFEEL